MKHPKTPVHPATDNEPEPAAAPPSAQPFDPSAPPQAPDGWVWDTSSGRYKPAPKT